MASRGDAVECRCGALLKLENERIPWHKKPDTRFNCPWSGTAAENWDPVHVLGGFVLACPACGEKTRIGNAPKDKHLLACRACGVIGTVQEFVAEAVERKKVVKEPVRQQHRYGR